MAMLSKLSSSASSYSMSNSHQYSSFIYDVFLSFRGEDTRKTFTDHLYTALKQAGLRIFRDDDAIERGRLLKPELEKAIQQSEVSLIVFSKSYATSKWCLDEVLMIMEEYDKSTTSSTNKCREVVPVFYNIEPTDVRNQTGYFEEAFKGYDDEVTGETDVQKKMELWEKVNTWRASLRKVESLNGMVLGEDGFEAECITDIVNVVRKKVNYNALYIKEKLVGRNKDVAEIESWLQDMSPNSTILLINGMGGVGKTTIAKCVYNMNYREYEGSCFLANVNEKSNQSGGMLLLQRQLLSTTLKSEKEETIWNEYEGTIKVANAIYNKKVLIVLDDVATLRQLDTLLGPQRFYAGSKVIVTTRHTWLSTAFTIPPMVQTIRTLSNDDSIELFSLYAFPQKQPIDPYYYQSEQVNQVIHHCEGLPLALEVLGSNLRGKSIPQWKDAMSKLEKYPLDGIQKVLQLSYDSLEDHHDKDLFLHYACFFVGEDEDFIVKVLGECKLYPIIGIKNLTDRGLLYIEYGKVGMHQLIREMGKQVVRQESPKDPGKRSRLWDHEDCINVLQENVGTKNVKGFRLVMQNMRDATSKYIGKKMVRNETNFKIKSLEKMKNLMLLQLSYVTFFGEYKKLPKNLRLLSWHGFPLKCIPCNIPLEKLVVLDMSYSKLEHVWDDLKIIRSLKILNLSHSVKLIKTPDFGGLPGLESLILKGCTSLIKVHESIANLEGLVLIDLTDCRSLRNVPCLPRSLESIQMSSCPNIEAVGRFEWYGITSLPSLLVHLNISYCNLFDTSFPNDWSNLVSLSELRIDGNNVTHLPKCIQSLPRLAHLFAVRCSQMQSIQGVPKTLRELDIEGNISLKKIEVSLEVLLKKQGILVSSLECPNLCYMQGNFKWQSIDKVEKKILKKLGLGTEMGLHYSKQKVVFEYGIFSTLIRKEQIPFFFTYKERGPQISFKVPCNDTHRIISGFNLCIVVPPICYVSLHESRIEVYNMTKDLLWIYYPGFFEKATLKGWWLSVWRCGNMLQEGDQIFISIRYREKFCRQVEECRVNLIYDDDDDDDDDDDWAERKEVNDDEIVIRWTDRMFIDISDYVHTHMTYYIGKSRAIDYDRGLQGGLVSWMIDGERRELMTSKSVYKPMKAQE
uniref:disease resistance protein RUN1-like n=1 Tax=Erigeron canadensis TaxID=72917 RepID=UPI001CB92414|nr:disease resistance protein RUN1-like [Erigeron canadensis]